MIKSRIKRNLVFILTSLFVVNSIVPSVGFAETGLGENKNILSRIVNKVGEKKDKLKCFVREHAKAIMYSTVGLGLLGVSASFNVKQQEKIKKLEEERDSFQKLNVANEALDVIRGKIDNYGQALKQVQQEYDEASLKINEYISQENKKLDLLEKQRNAIFQACGDKRALEEIAKLEGSRTLRLAPLRAIIESPEVTVEGDNKKIKVKKDKAFQIDVEVAESRYVSIKDFAFRNGEISQKLVNDPLNYKSMLNLVSDFLKQVNTLQKGEEAKKKKIDIEISKLTKQMQDQNGEKERGEIEKLKEQLKKLPLTEEASSDLTPEDTSDRHNKTKAKKGKKSKETDATTIEQKIAGLKNGISGLEDRIAKYEKEKPQLQSQIDEFQQQSKRFQQKIDNYNKDKEQLEEFKKAWLKEYVVEHLGQYIDKNVFAQLKQKLNVE